MKTNNLTSKQQKFVDLILAGSHPTQAAEDAGYGYPPQAALTLSKTPAVMAAIAAGRGSKKTEEASEKKSAEPSKDKLRDALRDVIGDTLDEARVRAIVEDAVKREQGLAPTRIEVVNPKGKAVEIGTQHYAFPELMTMLGAGLNVYLAGPAGTGKTTAARNAAEAMSKMTGKEIPFYFNGAIDSEHKLLGFIDAQGRVVSRPFRKAFLEGGIYLFDEVDASLAGALLAFNAALSNDVCDFPDGCFAKHENFRCVAAANTWGFGATHDYVGRAKLDEAFRDRFAMLEWSTDEKLERQIALGRIADRDLGERWITRVQKCRANAQKSGVRCVISPRASINGCALLNAGETWAKAETSCIRKGMADESWAQVSAA